MNNQPDVFIADNDQPFTCPYDGTRTEFVDVQGAQYIEACPRCGKTIHFEFEEDQHDNAL